MTKFELNAEEKQALEQIKKGFDVLSKRHWFYSADFELNIMRNPDNGTGMKKHINSSGFPSETVDQDYIVTSITNGVFEGGGW